VAPYLSDVGATSA